MIFARIGSLVCSLISSLLLGPQMTFVAAIHGCRDKAPAFALWVPFL